MTVRGAPAIGAAAAFGLALAAQDSEARTTPQLFSDLETAAILLKAPARRQLTWLGHLDRVLQSYSGQVGRDESRKSYGFSSCKKPRASRMKMWRSINAWGNTARR